MCFSYSSTRKYRNLVLWPFGGMDLNQINVSTLVPKKKYNQPHAANSTLNPRSKIFSPFRILQVAMNFAKFFLKYSFIAIKRHVGLIGEERGRTVLLVHMFFMGIWSVYRCSRTHQCSRDPEFRSISCEVKTLYRICIFEELSSVLSGFDIPLPIIFKEN